MKKVLKEILGCGAMGIALLAGGDVSGLSGAVVDYGNLKPAENELAEVTSTEILVEGKLDISKLRYVDLVCEGTCKFAREDEVVDVNIVGAERTNFFAVGEDGRVVFALPRLLSTTTAPTGRAVWGRFHLARIAGKNDDITKYVCLGLRRKNAGDNFIDILYYTPTSESDANNINSHQDSWIDLTPNDGIEAVALFSNTDLSEGVYTPVEIGKQITEHPIAAAYKGKEQQVDFGSVFRVDIQLGTYAWRIANTNLNPSNEEGVSLFAEDDVTWYNLGQLGVGPTSKGSIDFLVALSADGQLAQSNNGTNWLPYGDILAEGAEGEVWSIAPTYGNGSWYAASDKRIVHWSDDPAAAEAYTGENVPTAVTALSYGNGDLLAIEPVSDSKAKSYMFRDGQWQPISSTIDTAEDITFLCFGNGSWICGNAYGSVFKFISGRWEALKSNLSGLNVQKDVETPFDAWSGCCYHDGYFYAVRGGDHLLAKSADGINWESVVDFKDEVTGSNITFYDGKLFNLTADGNKCNIGRFELDGKIGNTLQSEVKDKPTVDPTPEEEGTNEPIVDPTPEEEGTNEPIVDPTPEEEGANEPVVDPTNPGGTTDPVVDPTPEEEGTNEPVVDPTNPGGTTDPVVDPTPEEEGTNEPVVDPTNPGGTTDPENPSGNTGDNSGQTGNGEANEPATQSNEAAPVVIREVNLEAASTAAKQTRLRRTVKRTTTTVKNDKK